jgi:hypothetical protein
MSDRLNDAYEAWRSLPIPEQSVDDELAEIHADLVVVDDWVAQSVVPFVEHTRYVFAAADVSGGISGVRDRAHLFVALRDGEDVDTAREYAAYAERLFAVYRELERTVMETAPSN